MLINCIGGHGDVMFCEPIYKYFWQRDGIKPTVIIHDHQMFFKDYIESANFIPASQMPQLRDDANMREGYIPLRWASQIHRGYALDYHDDFENVMLDKYRLLGLDEDLWKSLNINFNTKKSTDLLNQFTSRSYILINENSQAGKINLSFVNTNGKGIYMNAISRYNVIDWWEIIFYAEENHHVSTSTFYLMQAIKNKFREWNAPCYIYPRPNSDGLRGISQLKPDFNLIRVE